jgi:hypothetical protein
MKKVWPKLAMNASSTPASNQRIVSAENSNRLVIVIYPTGFPVYLMPLR